LSACSTGFLFEFIKVNHSKLDISIISVRAERFYLHLEAKDSGITVPSRLPSGPIFKKLIYTI